VAFDLLFDGEELIAEPIEERRRRLDSLAPGLTVTTAVVGDGLGLWSQVEARGLEGMVAKRLGSAYVPGARGDAWRKVARVAHVRVVVGGFTAGEGSRLATFGSLQVGLWQGTTLRWVGSVGTGFSDAMLRAIREALDAQTTGDSPFADDPDMPQGVTWVEPQLVAMVGIKEWTSHGRMRAPRFLGFTDDDPRSITWESERDS
jgi:bifunctional non-homologous end joining protein LigD